MLDLEKCCNNSLENACVQVSILMKIVALGLQL